MSEKILTLHPEGKQGANIDKAKYDQVRAAIVAALREAGELTFTGLRDAVHQQLAGDFDGAIGWYVTTVKLDLEAREVVERLPNRTPQHLRLAD